MAGSLLSLFPKANPPKTECGKNEDLNKEKNSDYYISKGNWGKFRLQTTPVKERMSYFHLKFCCFHFLATLPFFQGLWLVKKDVASLLLLLSPNLSILAQGTSVNTNKNREQNQGTNLETQQKARLQQHLRWKYDFVSFLEVGYKLTNFTQEKRAKIVMHALNSVREKLSSRTGNLAINGAL